MEANLRFRFLLCPILLNDNYSCMGMGNINFDDSDEFEIALRGASRVSPRPYHTVWYKIRQKRVWVWYHMVPYIHYHCKEHIILYRSNIIIGAIQPSQLILYDTIICTIPHNLDSALIIDSFIDLTKVSMYMMCWLLPHYFFLFCSLQFQLR
jgi:hypothetical protein